MMAIMTRRTRRDVPMMIEDDEDDDGGDEKRQGDADDDDDSGYQEHDTDRCCTHLSIRAQGCS